MLNLYLAMELHNLKYSVNIQIVSIQEKWIIKCF